MTVNELVAARKAAIERGDKALGREIYHQLQELGFSAEDIDGDRVRGPETAAVKAPEAAVRETPKPRGRPAKDAASDE